MLRATFDLEKLRKVENSEIVKVRDVREREPDYRFSNYSTMLCGSLQNM